jgi:hypothetical protein
MFPHALPHRLLTACLHHDARAICAVHRVRRIHGTRTRERRRTDVRCRGADVREGRRQ